MIIFWGRSSDRLKREKGKGLPNWDANRPQARKETRRDRQGLAGGKARSARDIGGVCIEVFDVCI